jgi:hypothetical protein
MIPQPEENVRARIRRLRERRYRATPRPAREIAMRAAARREVLGD